MSNLRQANINDIYFFRVLMIEHMQLLVLSNIRTRIVTNQHFIFTNLDKYLFTKYELVSDALYFIVFIDKSSNLFKKFNMRI